MALKRTGATRVALAFLSLLFGGCSSAITSNGSPPDAGAAPFDASLGGADAGSAQDSSVDAPGPDTAITCAPAGVKSYQPAWTPPKAPQPACTAAEIESYGDCIDSSGPTSAACAPWYGGDAGSACKSCLADSKQTDPAWGPLVDLGTTGSERQINVAGCMAILLHDTGSGCAGSVQALDLCEAAACADNCAGASTAALSACTQQADGAGCGNYVAAAACISDAGAASAACFPPDSATFGQKVAAIAAVFCTADDGG